MPGTPSPLMRGASLRELMDRMGHSRHPRRADLPALRPTKRQRKLADAVGEAARAALLRQRHHLARTWAREARQAIVERLSPTDYMALELVFFKAAPGRIRNPRPRLLRKAAALSG